MKLKLIKMGSLITLYNGIYAIVMGFFMIIFSKFLIKKYFEPFPEIWEILVKKWITDISQYHLILIYTGFLLVSFGIFLIYLSIFVMKKKDNLAWAVLFFGGILGWASIFVVNIIAKNTIMSVLGFIGWASFVIGMIIPVKYYIQKGYPRF